MTWAASRDGPDMLDRVVTRARCGGRVPLHSTPVQTGGEGIAVIGSRFEREVAPEHGHEARPCCRSSSPRTRAVRDTPFLVLTSVLIIAMSAGGAVLQSTAAGGRANIGPPPPARARR